MKEINIPLTGYLIPAPTPVDEEFLSAIAELNERERQIGLMQCRNLAVSTDAMMLAMYVQGFEKNMRHIEIVISDCKETVHGKVVTNTTDEDMEDAVGLAVKHLLRQQIERVFCARPDPITDSDRWTDYFDTRESEVGGPRYWRRFTSAGQLLQDFSEYWGNV